jgi:hypothetical protein
VYFSRSSYPCPPHFAVFEVSAVCFAYRFSACYSAAVALFGAVVSLGLNKIFKDYIQLLGVLFVLISIMIVISLMN